MHGMSTQNNREAHRDLARALMDIETRLRILRGHAEHRTGGGRLRAALDKMEQASSDLDIARHLLDPDFYRQLGDHS